MPISVARINLIFPSFAFLSLLKAFIIFEVSISFIKEIDTSKIIKALSRDKKAKEGKIRFILATEIGKVETRDDVPPEIIKEVLQEITVETK